MSMQHIESELRKQGKGDLADLIASVHRMNSKDIPFPDLTPPKVTTVEKPILKTPESVTNFWRTKLQTDGKIIGLDIQVPDCDWTTEEIIKPMMDYDENAIPSMMVYVPKELMGKEGLKRLGKMYPKMNNAAVSKDTFSTDVQTEDSIKDYPDSGKKGKWIKVEATTEPPNQTAYASDDELENFANKHEYIGQTLNTYILASQANKDLTGHYFDEKGTFSSLNAHTEKGARAEATFQPDGNLYIVWWTPYTAIFSVTDGIRFETTKKA